MRFCKKKVTVIQEHNKYKLTSEFLKEKAYHSRGLLKTHEHAHKQTNEHTKICI